MKYGLTTETIPDKPTPVVAGTNWYEGFDTPAWDARGRFWMIGNGDLGRVRGGHAFVLLPDGLDDSASWWEWFNQGQEGACVGFAAARMMALLNRRRYDARELYLAAQRVDDWPGENYSGTSVRAGLDVLRQRGPMRVRGSHVTGPHKQDGIEVFRWATSVPDILASMHSPRYLKMGRLRFLNSWGKGYPHFTWMPLDVVDRLIREEGEFGLVTDR